MQCFTLVFVSSSRVLWRPQLCHQPISPDTQIRCYSADFTCLCCGLNGICSQPLCHSKMSVRARERERQRDRDKRKYVAATLLYRAVHVGFCCLSVIVNNSAKQTEMIIACMRSNQNIQSKTLISLFRDTTSCLCTRTAYYSLLVVIRVF